MSSEMKNTACGFAEEKNAGEKRDPAKRLPSVEDCIAIEDLTGGDYLESKGLAAYASNRTAGIILKDLNLGTQKKISVSGKGEGQPKFSYNGKYLMFLSATAEEGTQLFLYDLETETVSQLTHVPGQIMEARWSPDSTKVLFGAAMGKGGGKTKERPDEAIVIEHANYKFDGLGFIRPNNHTHLFVADIADGKVRQLTDGDRDYKHHTWMNDSRAIICASNLNRDYRESIGFDLYKIDVTEEHFGEKTQISKGYQIVSYPNPITPVVSPDDSYVIMGAMDRHADFSKGYPPIFFYRFPLDGSEPGDAFVPDEHCFQCIQFPYNAHSGHNMDRVQFDEEGKYVYFVSGFMGQCVLYRLEMGGNLHAEIIEGGEQVHYGLGRIQNGKMLVTRCSTGEPESYWIMEAATGKLLQKVVQSNEKLTEKVALSSSEDFFFNTLDGESRVHTWVMPPVNREEGKKYPALLYVHGGPHPFYTYGFDMEFQMFAGAGYAVIYANPRGSTGYGLTHANLKRAMDGSAYTDLLQAVDEACSRYDWIDPDRVAVTGGSYGGYMTNYMITHCERFKAYITQRSIANDLISYASSDMSGSSRGAKSFEEFMVGKLKTSAVTLAEKVHRPLLILHGIDDYRCPVEGAHQFYTAIKDCHPELPIRMVLFPHTPHDQPRDPKLLKIYYQEMIAWLDQYDV